MGTRHDYYKATDITDPATFEWVGSDGWDGYPSGVASDGLNAEMTEAEFDAYVQEHVAIKPDRGWPWRWEDSGTTDFAYVWCGGAVSLSCFGRKLVPFVDEHDDEANYMDGPKVPWPNMSVVQRVEMGPDSGLIVLTAPKGGAA